MLFNRQNSSFFFPAFVLEVAVYVLMSVIALLASKIFSLSDVASFVISFLISYVGMVIILWKINGSDILNAVQSFHSGPDFLGFLLPYILSNMVLIIWTIVKHKE
jgi:hypothetical protein